MDLQPFLPDDPASWVDLARALIRVGFEITRGVLAARSFRKEQRPPHEERREPAGQ